MTAWWERDGRPSFVGDLKYRRTHVDQVNHADIYQLLAYTIATVLPAAPPGNRVARPDPRPAPPEADEVRTRLDSPGPGR